MTSRYPADLGRPGDSGGFRVPAHVRATVIPSIAVPLSLVGTFGVMYLLGYTLDNLSLMAWPSPLASWWTMPSW